MGHTTMKACCFLPLALVAAVSAQGGVPHQPADKWVDAVEPIEAAGACMDDADQAAWKKESPNFAADMAKCGKQCLGGKACVSTCMQKAGGYTAACGDCMGTVADCTKTHCMLQCIQGDSPACTACVKKAGCDTAFTTCSGVTPPSSVNVKKVVMMAAGAAPSGTYTGEVKELGADVKATLTIVDTSHIDVDVEVSGIVTVSVNCKKEQYNLSGSTVVLPNLSKPGDCLHDDLAKDTVTLKSVTYDASDDSITISVHKILNISVKLKKA